MEISQKKVLIIEDEVSILNGVADKFGYEGFVALKATNGQEGLDLALKEHPDIILLDILMPNTDGFYMLEKLRQDPWGKDARVMMWSISHDEKTFNRAIKLGVMDFMVKSNWEYKDLVEKVRMLLGK